MFEMREEVCAPREKGGRKIVEHLFTDLNFGVRKDPTDAPISSRCTLGIRATPCRVSAI